MRDPTREPLRRTWGSATGDRPPTTRARRRQPPPSTVEVFAAARRRMVTALHPRHLLPPAWLPAFSTVRREVFVARDLTDARWPDTVYDADRALPARGDTYPVAFTAAPAAVARLLAGLSDTDRVVVGDDGYLIAVVCHYLGGARVTAVHPTPQTLERNRAGLTVLGYFPRLHCGAVDRANLVQVIPTGVRHPHSHHGLAESVLRPGGVVLDTMSHRDAGDRDTAVRRPRRRDRQQTGTPR